MRSSARSWSLFRFTSCGWFLSLWAILLYLVALAFGIAIHYSIMLTLAAVSFWIVRAQGLVYGYFNFLNIARYPDVIFPQYFRLIFGWIIPVVIVANIPARLLIKSLGSTRLANAPSGRRRDDCRPHQPRFLALRRSAIIPAPVPRKVELISAEKGLSKTSPKPLAPPANCP